MEKQLVDPVGMIVSRISVEDYLNCRKVSHGWREKLDHETVWKYLRNSHWPELPKVQDSWKKLGWSVINLLRGRLFKSDKTWSPTKWDTYWPQIHYRWKVVGEMGVRGATYSLYRADLGSNGWVLSGFKSDRRIHMFSARREGLKADPILVTASSQLLVIEDSAINCFQPAVIGYRTNGKKLWAVKSPVRNEWGKFFSRSVQIHGNGFWGDRPVFSVCWNVGREGNLENSVLCVYSLLKGKLLHQQELRDQARGNNGALRWEQLCDGSLGMCKSIQYSVTWWRFDGSEWKVLESQEADSKNGLGDNWFHAVKGECMELKIRLHRQLSLRANLPEELDWVGLDWKGKRMWTWHAPYTICGMQFRKENFLAFSVLEGFKVTRKLPITTFRKADRWEYFCTCPPDVLKKKPVLELVEGQIRKTGSDCMIQ